MDKDSETPSLMTWLLASMPVGALIVAYKPELEVALGALVLCGGGIALYRIGRWAVTRIRAMVQPGA